MKTVTLQIGNTDDKLTQKEWSDFVNAIRCLFEEIPEESTQIHFFGASQNFEEWQNVAWVFTTNQADYIKMIVARIRKTYRQDSAAWTEGETIFV